MPSTASALKFALVAYVGAALGLTTGVRDDPALLRRACPDYNEYSQVPQYATPRNHLGATN